MVTRVAEPTRGALCTGGLLAAVGLILMTLSTDVAVAQEKKPTHDVTVWAIRATKSNSEISPDLRPIAEQLKKQFKYTGFKLEKKAAKPGVDEGSTFSASLIAGFSARITPVERKDNRIKLKIEVIQRKGKQQRPRMRTTVTIDRGRFPVSYTHLTLPTN